MAFLQDEREGTPPMKGFSPEPSVFNIFGRGLVVSGRSDQQVYSFIDL